MRRGGEEREGVRGRCAEGNVATYRSTRLLTLHFLVALGFGKAGGGGMRRVESAKSRPLHQHQVARAQPGTRALACGGDRHTAWQPRASSARAPLRRAYRRREEEGDFHAWARLMYLRPLATNFICSSCAWRIWARKAASCLRRSSSFLNAQGQTMREGERRK